MKIKVLSPDINESNRDFTIVEDKDSIYGKAIRFGLGAIKNVGDAAINAIITEREANGHFASFVDFLSRVDARKVNKKVLESLIKAGTMSSFGSRTFLLKNMDSLKEKFVKRTNTSDLQQGLFGEDEIKMSSSSLVLGEDVFKEDFNDEEIENFEKQLLGFSLSSKPVSEILGAFDSLATHRIDEVWDENLDIKEVTLAGVIREVRVVLTKKIYKKWLLSKLKM